MVFCIIYLQANVLSNEAKVDPQYGGNRILLTAITIVESNKDELKISMNAINTGRNLIEFGIFSEIPEDLELKFEESFYRSSLKSKEDEIKNLLFAKVMKLPAGKIVRNIELNLSSDEALYKSLGKKKQRYARHYQPKVDKTKPGLKYKTKEETPSALGSILKKRNKNKEKVAVKSEIKIEEEVVVDVETVKKQQDLISEEEKRSEEAKKQKLKAEAAEKAQEKETKRQADLAKAKAKEDAAIRQQKEREIKQKADLAKAESKEKEAAEEAKSRDTKRQADLAVAKEKEDAKLAAEDAKQKAAEKKRLEEQKKAIEKQLAKDNEILEEERETLDRERKALAEAKKKEIEEAKLAEAKNIEVQKKAEKKRLAESSKNPSKKEIKATDEKFKKIEEKQKKEEDDEAVLSALGLDEKETQTSTPSKKRSGSLLGGKDDEEKEGFDMSESIEASKNSYSLKEVCPDLYIDTIFVVKQNNRWLEIEYILNNTGKGPAHLLGQSSSDDDNLAIRAFLSSSERLTRGSLPIGGGFIYNSPNDGLLEVNGTYRGKLKLDIKKLTRFTPYLILSVDPFNAITECDKTNNKHPSLINQ